MATLSWPDPLPRRGRIRLRPFDTGDLDLVAAFAADPYVPLIGSIPSPFTHAEGLAYLERQHQRLADGTGWSFAIADLGHRPGSRRRRTVAARRCPRHRRIRGRGDLRSAGGLPPPRLRR